MHTSQEHSGGIIDTICREAGCTDAAGSLREGFAVIFEAQGIYQGNPPVGGDPRDYMEGNPEEDAACCSHCGCVPEEKLEKYDGRLLCPDCLREFRRIDAAKGPDGVPYSKYTVVPSIPASFWPTTEAQAKLDKKLIKLGIAVDWSSYVASLNGSWKSQGMPSGTAKAYRTAEAARDGGYKTYMKSTICFYEPVAKLARTPVEKIEVNDRMGSDYREIGVDTRM